VLFIQTTIACNLCLTSEFFQNYAALCRVPKHKFLGIVEAEFLKSQMHQKTASKLLEVIHEGRLAYMMVPSFTARFCEDFFGLA